LNSKVLIIQNKEKQIMQVEEKLEKIEKELQSLKALVIFGRNTQ